MKIRILKMWVVAVLLMSSLTGFADVYSGGDGTEGNPYQISTTDDLVFLGTDSGNWYSQFILTTNLDMSGVAMSPIGGNGTADFPDSSFGGQFDGQGYAISHLTINLSAKNDVGLFGAISWGGKVKNLNLVSVSVTGKDRVGGLAGSNNTGHIHNCHTSGVVKGMNDIGGLLGKNEGVYFDDPYGGDPNATERSEGAVNRCSSSCDVVANAMVSNATDGWNSIWNIGGLVGHNLAYVGNSVATGTVRKLSGASNTVTMYNCGGLVGKQGANDQNPIAAEMINSYATGEVHGSLYVGGLVGSAQRGSLVLNSYATGDVIGEGDAISSTNNDSSAVGGLIGEVRFATVKNCYTLGGTVSSAHISGGLIGNYNGKYNELVGSLKNCFSASGLVSTSDGSNKSGGVIGQALEISSATTVSGCTWDKDSTGMAVDAILNAMYGVHSGELTSVNFKDSLGWDFGRDNQHPWYDPDGAVNVELPRLYWQRISTPTTVFAVVDEESELVLSVYRNPISTGPTVYALINTPPAGCEINSDTGVIRWVPTEEQGGPSYPGEDYTLTVNKSELGASTNVAIKVRVNKVNKAPIVGNDPNDEWGNYKDELEREMNSAEVGVVFSKTISAFDTDLPLENLSFSLEGAPAGMSLGTPSVTDGIASVPVSWTPTAIQGGISAFKVVVTDEHALTDEVTIKCFVNVPFTFPTGSGTSQDPYLIATPTQLKAIGENTTFWNKHFKVTANLDLTGLELTPIGFFVDVDYQNNFKFIGTFDGDNYTINHLNMDYPNLENVGLFGLTIGISSGYTTNDPISIKNVTLRNASVTGKNNVGVLVGRNWISKIDRCEVANSVINGERNVGGLVGCNDSNSTITNSGSSATVNGNVNVGGLVGYSMQGFIYASYAEGSVSGLENIGGLIGSSYRANCQNSYSSATVEATVKVAGGLIGKLDSTGTNGNCYAMGSVTAPNDAGGLVGLKAEYCTASFYSSYWDTDKTGQGSSPVGTGLTSSELKSKDFSISPNNWPFGIDPNQTGELQYNEFHCWKDEDTDSYPYLFWQKSKLYVNEGDQFSYQSQLSGTSYYLENGDVNMLVSSTGLVTWNTTEADGGREISFTIHATENIRAILSEEITLVVEEVNTAPSLTVQTNHELFSGEMLSFQAVATDTDRPFNTLTFSMDQNAPSEASLNSGTGVFSWTTTAADIGSYTFDLAVSDGTVNVSKSITVTVKDSNFPNGLGSSESPYQLETVTQLQLLANEVLVDGVSLYDGKFFIQMADIDLSAVVMQPIPSSQISYDGNGFTISNLTLLSDTAYVGLFAAASGEFKNINLLNLNVTGTRVDGMTLGGLLGLAYGATTIANCYVTGIIQSDTTATYVAIGGLVGHINGAGVAVNRCLTDVTVSAKGDSSIFAGGLVGKNNSGSIINSCSDGTVTVETVEGVPINGYGGGLVGTTDGTGGSIKNCYSTAAVSSNERAGGLVGAVFAGEVENCYYTGRVFAKLDAGGITAWVDASATIKNCYNIGLVLGEGSTGALTDNCSGTVVESYWDKEKTYMSWDDGADSSFGLTTEEINTKDFSGAPSSWGFGQSDENPWVDLGNTHLPQLSWRTTIGNIHTLKTEAETTIQVKFNVMSMNTRQVLTYSLTGAPSGATIDTHTGVFQWTPTERDSGRSKTFTVSATSGGNPRSELITIVVEENEFSGGNGSAANPYKITTAAEFKKLGDSYLWWHSDFKLTTDIDVDGLELATIGSYNERAYTGKFNGNGYTISNLSVKTDSYRFGCFGTVIGGEISNLIIENANIDSSNKHAATGILCGYIDNSTVTNCRVSGISKGGKTWVGGLIGMTKNSQVTSCVADLVDVDGKWHVGGLVGSTNTTTIDRCSASGDVYCTVWESNASLYVGGLVGELGSVSVIQNSKSSAKVEAYTIFNTSYAYAGGLVGRNYGVIKSSFATGEVKSFSEESDCYAGGIVGTSFGSIVNCYATATTWVSNDDPQDVMGAGGVVGLLRSPGTLTNCYASGLVSASDKAGIKKIGGLIGHSEVGNGSFIDSYWNNETTGQETTDGSGSGGALTELEFRAFDFSALWPFGVTTDSPWSDDGIHSYPTFSWLNLIITPIEPQIIQIGEHFSLSIGVQSQSPVSFSFVGFKPLGLVMTQQGRLMWTPSNYQADEYTVRVRVENQDTSKVVSIVLLVGDYKEKSTVNVTVSGSGLVNGEQSLSFEVVTGTALPSVTAVADTNYQFFGYRGDYTSQDSEITLPMVTDDMEIEAFFDLDTNQNDIPDSWEDDLHITYTGELTIHGDIDGDGIPDYIEFLRDTNPFVFNIIMYPGWNLIHIPNTLTVEQNDLDAIFQNQLLGMLWKWSPFFGYQQVTTLVPGIGIWAFWDGEEEVIAIPGEPALQQQITLKEGWNLVGVVESEIIQGEMDVSRVFVSEPIGKEITISAVFYWDGDEQIYQPLNPRAFDMAPGLGYWIFSNLTSDE